MTKQQQFTSDCFRLGLILSINDESEKLVAAYKRGEQWAVDEVKAFRSGPSALLFD